MALATGTAAPDFTLVDQTRTPVSLTDLQGRKGVIAFMPFALSRTCTGEMCELRDNLAALGALDAAVVAITADSLHANRAWAEAQGIEFPILSDFWPHGAVATAYDTFNEMIGCADRTTYILDPAGIIRAAFTTEGIGVARNFADYVAALDAI